MNQEITFIATLPATPHGARSARQLAAAQLADWGLPFPDAAQVVAELAANAVTHGRLPGRRFRLALTAAGATLRIEVSDTRAEHVPPPSPELPPTDAESGRGLALVAALADRWGVCVGPVPLKTVWAEMGPPGSDSPDPGFRDPVGGGSATRNVNP
ncbi:ATP-binding protein [Streptomyces sp. AP-93]|uniref:ATP-binding protein n=1 Tax=Streptomyces sp. AP-93 TaxID=2929048 RepID=UPI001FAF4AFA|nr:ATP-binding protein [Streptomyces sp. AP-93]MCJ0867993.1 ATP-binding protein [Streptomyces sp. AP-93]